MTNYHTFLLGVVVGFGMSGLLTTWALYFWHNRKSRLRQPSH